MKRIFAVWILIALGACSSSKKYSSGSESERPDWISSRPNTSSYYVGVGFAPKSMGTNYQQIAKKNALQDLISEISVTVSTQSFLHQIDDDYEVSEEYQSMIKTSANQHIEDYELVDSWEDVNGYWIFYRLSKQKYALAKMEAEENAKNLALDYYKKAKAFEQGREITAALDFYIKSLYALQDYLAEPVEVTLDQHRIYLGNELFNSIQRVLDRLSLQCEPSTINLKSRLKSGSKINLDMIYDYSVPVKNMPVKTGFKLGSGNISSNTTDYSGRAVCILNEVSSKTASSKIYFTVDLQRFIPASNEDDFVGKIISKFRTPEAIVVVNVSRPTVYLTSSEKLFGVNNPNPQMYNEFRSLLSASGFNFTTDRAQADYWIDLNTNTEKGHISGNIYLTYLTMIIKVRDMSDNVEIFSENLNRIKGFSLDYERSSMEAYRSALSRLNDDVLPGLLAIL